jgi:hypothetical protein
MNIQDKFMNKPNVGEFFGHPSGLKTLFFTEMWERMSYYGMRMLLVLFMTATLQEQGLGLTVASAAAIYGLYTGCVYFMGLPGGWIADINRWPKSSMVWWCYHHDWPYHFGNPERIFLLSGFDFCCAWNGLIKA